MLTALKNIFAELSGGDAAVSAYRNSISCAWLWRHCCTK